MLSCYMAKRRSQSRAAFIEQKYLNVKKFFFKWRGRERQGCSLTRQNSCACPQLTIFVTGLIKSESDNVERVL